MFMLGRKETDPIVRARIAAWTRYLMRSRGYANPTEMARKLGVTRPAVSTVLRGTRTPGLDYLVKLHRVFHIQADVLLDEDPPTAEQRSDPADAFSENAAQRRQTHHGGH